MNKSALIFLILSHHEHHTGLIHKFLLAYRTSGLFSARRERASRLLHSHDIGIDFGLEVIASGVIYVNWRSCGKKREASGERVVGRWKRGGRSWCLFLAEAGSVAMSVLGGGEGIDRVEVGGGLIEVESGAAEEWAARRREIVELGEGWRRGRAVEGKRVAGLETALEGGVGAEGSPVVRPEVAG